MTSTACDLDARGAGGGDAAEAAKGAALSPLPPQAALEALLEPSTAFAPRLALPSAPTCAFLLEAGWACLARRSSGGLQVMALYLPGDLVGFDLASTPLGDGQIIALTAGRLRILPAVRRARMTQHGSLIRRVAAQNLEHHRRLQDHVFRLSALPAYERTAHLLVELHERLSSPSATPSSVEVPVKQEVLASALGMSLVHLNRVFMTLKAKKLAWLERGRLTVPDPAALRAVSQAACPTTRTDEPLMGPRIEFSAKA